MSDKVDQSPKIKNIDGSKTKLIKKIEKEQKQIKTAMEHNKSKCNGIIDQQLECNRQVRQKFKKYKSQEVEQMGLDEVKLSYRANRTNYIQEVRSDCKNLKINWQSYALILYYSDTYFSQNPFTKNSREESFAIFVLLASKLTQQVPIQMKALVESLKIKNNNYQYFRQLQKLIIRRLNFRLQPKTFPFLINIYMASWDQQVCKLPLGHQYLILSDDRISYHRYRLILWSADMVAIRSVLKLGTIKTIMKTVLEKQMRQEDLNVVISTIFPNIAYLQLQIHEIQALAKYIRQQSTNIDNYYDQKHKYSSYGQFLMTYIY